MRLRDAAEAETDGAEDLLVEHRDAGSDARTHWTLARDMSRPWQFDCQSQPPARQR